VKADAEQPANIRDRQRERPQKVGKKHPLFGDTGRNAFHKDVEFTLQKIKVT